MDDTKAVFEQLLMPFKKARRMRDEFSLADELYEAYAAACAMFKGARMPAWATLSRDEQICWTSTALPLHRVELRLSQQLAQAKSELVELDKRLLKLEIAVKDRECGGSELREVLELRETHTRLREVLELRKTQGMRAASKGP